MARKPHLSEALAGARRRTDELFGLLAPDALYDRPIPERHRNVFYLGHLEAFDGNLICRGALAVPSFHPEFDKLSAAADGGLASGDVCHWIGVRN